MQSPTSLVPLLDLGLSADTALEITFTIGLVAMVVLIGLLFRLGVAGMQTVGEGHRTDELAGRFIHTLVPIALAYVVAHYFSLLAYNGQDIVRLASDPLINQALKLSGAQLLFGRHNDLLDPQGGLLAEIVEILPPLRKAEDRR